MAHFAKIDEAGTVITVLVVADRDCVNAEGIEDESVGQQYLERTHNHPAALWKKTSYNTHDGVHKLGKTPFRKNYATVGGIYDSGRDAFYQHPDKKQFPSWVLNEETCHWEAPVAMPDTEYETIHGTMAKDPYAWNESTLSWDKLNPPVGTV